MSYLAGVATGTLVPSTSEDKPPTPVPALTPPTESEPFDPHDYDEVPEDAAARNSRSSQQGNGIASVRDHAYSEKEHTYICNTDR